MTQSIYLLLAASFAVLLLSLMPIGAAAQSAQRAGELGLRTTIGAQRYDFGELNSVLEQANFPAINRSGIHTEVALSVRGAGRTRYNIGFWSDHHRQGGSTYTYVPDPDVIALQRITRMNGGGIIFDFDYDLFYPSAWNLYAGVSSNIGISRLQTTSATITTIPAASIFEQQFTKNNFEVPVLGLRPQLTLETIPLANLRVVASVGYRFAITHVLNRSEDERISIRNVDVEMSGYFWQLGINAIMRAR